jgi:hypothetical protein
MTVKTNTAKKTFITETETQLIVRIEVPITFTYTKVKDGDMILSAVEFDKTGLNHTSNDFRIVRRIEKIRKHLFNIV